MINEEVTDGTVWIDCWRVVRNSKDIEVYYVIVVYIVVDDALGEVKVVGNVIT